MSKRPALVLNVFVGFPSYGGNGGIASEHPHVREWWAETLLKMKSDPRVGEVVAETISDTPITMVRNKFVRRAQEEGCHVLMMVDSDQSPNKYKGESWFKPFWDEAFNTIYDGFTKYKAGLCVGAPYCGPPPFENIYVFQFDNDRVQGDETVIRLNQFSRAEASKMSGISEVAALPTGLIMFDMRLFDMVKPTGMTPDQILELYKAGLMDKATALADLKGSWFHYEYTDSFQSEKASTEDVVATRDLAFAIQEICGYNPLRCAWDSWIGHWKPWNVGRPQLFQVEQIAPSYRRAVQQGRSADETVVDRSLDDALAEFGISKDRIRTVSPNGNGNGHGAPGETLVRYTDNGREPMEFGRMTPPEHLKALAELVEHLRGRLGRAPRVVEIGSWVGESAVTMAKAGAEVLCVDHFLGTAREFTGKAVYEHPAGEMYRRFLENTKDLPIRHLKGASTDVAEQIKSEGNPYSDISNFDLIVIDADHSYESTKNDILAWLPLVADDGVMIGHDYLTQQFPGVTRAVKEVFGDIARTYAIAPSGAYWMVEMSEWRKAGTMEAADATQSA